MIEKKKRRSCVSCKGKGELTDSDRAVIKRARQTEPSMNNLVRRYGAVGVLKLLALTYADMYDKSGDEVEHLAAAMISEFSEIVKRRCKDKNTRIAVKDTAH